MLLSSSQIERLIQALDENFTNLDLNLKITRRLNPPQRFEDIVAGVVGRREQMLRLVDYFEKRQKVEQLLSWADEADTNDSTFDEILHELTTNPAGELIADPFQDPLTFRGNQPLVNRGELRQELSKLQAATSQILVVNGDRRSGRTYSRQLIYSGAGRHQFIPIDVDLLDLKPADDDLRPEHIGQDIVLQMGFSLNDMPPRQNEQDSAWNRKFCAWLMGQVRRQNHLYWIIIDHSDRLPLLPGVEDFLFELTTRCDQMDRLRLVFLGFHKPERLNSDLRLLQPVSKEDIPPITDTDLIEFFFTYHQRRQGTVPAPAGNGDEFSEKITKKTAKSVKNVQAHITKQEEDGKVKCYLSCLKEAIEAELQREQEGNS